MKNFQHLVKHFLKIYFFENFSKKPETAQLLLSPCIAGNPVAAREGALYRTYTTRQLLLKRFFHSARFQRRPTRMLGVNIPDMHIEDIRQSMRALGAKNCHEERVLRAWLQARPLDTGTRRQHSNNFLPLELRQALPEMEAMLGNLARVHSEHEGEDGSRRLLVSLHDNQTVESVLLPRDGLCVSTQIGCAVGCVFCMTGQEGLIRQVGSAEIAAQLVLARQRRAVKRVVFMGMGEPSHNMENVLEAIHLFGTAGGIGHKNLVFSSVGDRRIFERLPEQEVKPALALSLHTTDPELRARLLPKAPHIAPAELVELGEIYARRTGYPIQYQWTLLEGINDTLEEMDRVAELLQGKYAMMNLIPYNTVDASGFRRPSWARARELADALNRRRILTKLRNSAGQDIDGGCGQLRARAIAADGQAIEVHRRKPAMPGKPGVGPA